MRNKVTPSNITSLQPNEVFIFGSNLSGIHGGGAAKTALQWGAVTGEGIGHFGQTYALPTKSKGIERTLTIDEIKPHVEVLILYVKVHPEMHFLLTEVGCGLAGIKHEDIAPLFIAAIDVDNISLPQKFIDILSPLQITKGYKVTDKHGKCRNHLFEVGQQYKHNGPLKICASGFHFCLKAAHCFNYYTFSKENRVFEIIAYGPLDAETSGDTKRCALHIEIARELDWQEILFVANDGADNTGHSNTGGWNTGGWNTGGWNTGYRNTGGWNTGGWNTGYRNTGGWNTGGWNTGDRNTGYSNTGDRNTGGWNTGDRNTGYSNTGDRNTGGFCTGSAPFPMFNKKSSWTEQDFLNSKAYYLLNNYVNTKMWVQESAMTKDEKEANPSYKTAEGYLKDIPFKEAFKNAWHNFSEDNKKAFTSLPNFNEKIFQEITGVKVGK